MSWQKFFGNGKTFAS